MRSWLTNLLDLLQVITAAVALIISIVEAIHEGIRGIGQQKKQEALKHWEVVRPELRKVIEGVLGERWARLFDLIASDRVISVVIDLLVALFNATGFFPKEQQAQP